MLGTNSTNDFCETMKTPMIPDGSGHVFYPTHQFSTRWKGRQSLTTPDVAINDIEGEEIETREILWNKTVYMPLCYTAVAIHLQRNP